MFPIRLEFYFEKRRVTTEALERACHSALQKVQNSKDFEFDISIFQTPTSMNIENKCHIRFIEITKHHPCIMFNSGYFKAKNEILYFFSEKELKNDVTSLVNPKYKYTDNLNSYFLQPSFVKELAGILPEIVKSYFDAGNHIEKVWFKFNNSKNIDVVGGRDYDEDEEILKEKIGKENLDEARRADLKRRFNNDIYDYGDKDTFIDTCIFLSKYLPDPKLHRSSSTPQSLRVNSDKNLVVIGGPGIENDEGNLHCKHFMARKKSNIQYRFDAERGFFLEIKGKPYWPSEDDADLKFDYGYFACFNNPHNEKNRVILINGIHTLGVLGSFLAFSDKEPAWKNYKTILEKAAAEKIENDKLFTGEMLEFECFFKVEISGKMPKVPIIQPENVFFFNNFLSSEREQPDPAPSTPIGPTDNLPKDLLLSIQASINAASNQSFANKEALKALNGRIGKTELTLADLEQIWKIVAANKTLPDENVKKINAVLDKKTQKKQWHD